MFALELDSAVGCRVGNVEACKPHPMSPHPQLLASFRSLWLCWLGIGVIWAVRASLLALDASCASPFGLGRRHAQYWHSYTGVVGDEAVTADVALAHIRTCVDSVELEIGQHLPYHHRYKPFCYSAKIVT